ncbi:hypothetical protein KJ682_09495 [bacterium]|nr:hypothetical protein [bacterium]
MSSGPRLLSILALIGLSVLFLAPACAGSPQEELDSLVSPGEQAILLEILGRIDPPQRIRDLARYGRRQSDLGGGFYGILPDQLADGEAIPVPTDADSRLAAALHLARQRRDNLDALARFNPEFVTGFTGRPLIQFLAEVEGMGVGSPADRPDLHLHLDTSALDGFLEALLDDGEITEQEASELAALPGNQAMLQHRRELGYVPEPLPDTGSLAAMIRLAGSTDPLDQLWCWLNPQNAFDYADLAWHVQEYRDLVLQLDENRNGLTGFVLDRIGRFTPPDVSLDATFALTVGWAIRGWVTPEMAGLNIEQVKDDWRFLLGTMIEETYHRLQLELIPSPEGRSVSDFSGLVAVATGAPRYDRFYEILTYTVAEGAANQVRGRFAAADLSAKAAGGAELLDRFVHDVVLAGAIDEADPLLNEGLKGNGPLYGLGWELAGLVIEADGPRAMGELQRKGPVAFVKRGDGISRLAGEPLLSPAVTAALDTLQTLLLSR